MTSTCCHTVGAIGRSAKPQRAQLCALSAAACQARAPAQRVCPRTRAISNNSPMPSQRASRREHLPPHLPPRTRFAVVSHPQTLRRDAKRPGGPHRAKNRSPPDRPVAPWARRRRRCGALMRLQAGMCNALCKRGYPGAPTVTQTVAGGGGGCGQVRTGGALTVVDPVSNAPRGLNGRHMAEICVCSSRLTAPLATCARVKVAQGPSSGLVSIPGHCRAHLCARRVRSTIQASHAAIQARVVQSPSGERSGVATGGAQRGAPMLAAGCSGVQCQRRAGHGGRPAPT